MVHSAEAGILAEEEDILVAAAVAVTPAGVVEVTLAADTAADITDV